MHALIDGGRNPGEREHVSDRAFRVLKAMRDLGNGPHSLRSIIGRTELSRSTVQRLIQSGMKNEVIWQPRHGYYALTENREKADPHPWQCVPASASTPGRHALGFLAEQSGHTAGLHAAVLTDVPVQVCVGCLDSPNGVSQRTSLGRPRPLAENAAGLAILAHLGLPHPRPGERHAIRFRGWASSPGPAPDSQMIAVPLLRFGLPVGALSITSGTDEIRGRLAAHVTALKRAAGHWNSLTARSTAAEIRNSQCYPKPDSRADYRADL
ncbi:helix-turn-helix domain-containing protein [Streptomyces sp. NBC_00096]|uniref:helix-turn-helix domain-containing protein n=1 Tax=Streptomyces sp. NBC_00096 TaxID=2975650 RepID=UPI0032546D66